jgi:putative tricarboxylic transport membrane protein
MVRAIMRTSFFVRAVRTAFTALCVVGAVSASGPLGASGWKPTQSVEIVVGTAPGSGPDRNARVVQKALQDHRILDVPTSVVNRPGAGTTVAGAYVNKFAGNGHYILLSGKAIIISDIFGRLAFPYTDLTPITHTMDEFIGIAVRTDSPIESGKDLLARLKKDPAAHSLAVATSLGNANHQALAAALKAVGGDPRKGRNVVFPSGGAAITALLGGHVDIIPLSLGVLAPELANARIRVLAISAPNRIPGAFGHVPTWRELGADAVVSQWRAAFGPRAMSAAQVAFWEETFKRLMATPEWQKDVESAYASSEFMGSEKTRRFIAEDYAREKAFLAELGLLKR